MFIHIMLPLARPGGYSKVTDTGMKSEPAVAEAKKIVPSRQN